MSTKCTLINDSNYGAYDTSYNTFETNGKSIGNCIDSTTHNLLYSIAPTPTPRPGCSEAEFACYANYNLEKSRQKLDSDLQNIYQPQNGPMVSFDESYQTTMLTGVLWAALGTTVLYYAFTKI